MNPPPSFDRLARLYRWMELLSFGPWLMRCRVAFLPAIAAHGSAMGRALVLGDGDGRFTARLLRACPGIEIDAVDASPAMLAELLRRAGRHASRVHPHAADARSFAPPHPPYQIIASHFFLDCLTTAEVADLARRLSAVAAPDAVWVVSEFAIPPGIYGRWIARPLVWMLYRAFGQMTGLSLRALPDHAAALAESGFRLSVRRAWLGGLLASELWRRVF
jgi:ubiquinone/menaquinone biosynthesis C-methylase UbiE